MALLNESTRNEVKQALAGMTRPVRLVMFTQGAGGVPECQMCTDTRSLAEEVSGLSDKVHLEVRDIVADAALAEKMHVDKIPALTVLSGDNPPLDYRFRLFGVPAGFEFSTFIEDLLLVSNQSPDLSSQTLAQLELIREPVHIQVFTTPT
jgi:alkyl hydroperoxide reductase subunit AhpF